MGAIYLPRCGNYLPGHSVDGWHSVTEQIPTLNKGINEKKNLLSMFTCLTADWFVTDVLAAAVACCDCCWEELPAAVAAAAVVVADAEPAAPDEPPELAADCDGGVGGAGAAASFLGLWGPAVSCGVLEGSTRTMIAILLPF